MNVFKILSFRKNNLVITKEIKEIEVTGDPFLDLCDKMIMGNETIKNHLLSGGGIKITDGGGIAAVDEKGKANYVSYHCE